MNDALKHLINEKITNSFGFVLGLFADAVQSKVSYVHIACIQ